MAVREEFQVHRLNEETFPLAERLAEIFSACLDDTQEVLNGVDAFLRSPESARCFALVKTKMQEACFFAKRALAVGDRPPR